VLRVGLVTVNTIHIGAILFPALFVVIKVALVTVLTLPGRIIHTTGTLEDLAVVRFFEI
jgi:hypothetical protein